MKRALLPAVLVVLLSGCSGERAESARLKAGRLDLSGADLARTTTALDGEWAFYPGEFAPPTDPLAPAAAVLRTPGAWNNQPIGERRLSGQGAGTYAARIILPTDAPALGLKLLTCSSACRYFVRSDGGWREVYAAGRPALDESEIPEYRPAVVALPPLGGDLELLIHVSNFQHHRGGLWRSPELGAYERLNRQRARSLYVDFFLIGALLIMGAYHAGISVLRRGNRSSLWLGCFCLLMALRISLTGEMALLEVFPHAPWLLRLKLEYMNFNLALAAFLAYGAALFPREQPRTGSRIVIAGAIGLAAFALLAPPEWFTRTLTAAQLWMGAGIVVLVWGFARAARARFEDARLFLTGVLVLAGAVVNDMLYSQSLSAVGYLAPLGMFIFIALQAIGLARRFASALSEVERLNESLETRVQQRTRELRIETERALEASRAKSQFLSTMAHEVRTPLNVVLGNVHLLLEEDLPTDQRRILESVQASSQSLSALLNDVLDLARIEAGKMLVQTSPFGLREQLEEIAAAFRPRAAERGNQLLVHFDPAAPRFVVADRIKLGQIITNLLSNAIKFTRGGIIELQVQTDNQAGDRLMVRFTVSDTGVGIAPDRLEAIFDKFTQENAHVSLRYGGAGLGLAIVQGLVALLEGDIAAESEPGRGSRFTVRLPLQSGEAPPAAERVESRTGTLAGLRILAAEDNPDNMALLRRLLERWGGKLTEAQNGSEAVDSYNSGEFDVILMDLQMPVMDGFEAARRIIDEARRQRKTVRIIAFTAAAVPEIRDRAYANGILEFLTKPVQPAELHAALARQAPGAGND